MLNKLLDGFGRLLLRQLQSVVAYVVLLEVLDKVSLVSPQESRRQKLEGAARLNKI